MLFFGVVVLSPVLETMLMSPILWAVSHLAQKPVVLAMLSACVWALLHSLAAPAWGLIVAWPFYVFSRAYLAWRPYGWWKAVGVTASIHAFQNLLPGLALALFVRRVSGTAINSQVRRPPCHGPHHRR